MGKSLLVIAVRGWTNTGEALLFGTTGGDFRPAVLNALTNRLPNAEIWAPDLDMGMFSMRAPELLASDLFQIIDAKLRTSPQIESIVLLSYSAGSLIARRVFCMAHGAGDDGTVSSAPAPWANLIDRLVVLAGITRGWEFSSASPAHVRFLGPILIGLAKLVGWWRRASGEPPSSTPMIVQLKRGAPFVVSTRIQYINVLHMLRARMERSHPSPLRAPGGLPSTVFLVGAKDEYISPADCTELGPRNEFAFIELHGSNHTEALHIDGIDPAASERKERLAAAIVDDFQGLASRSWAVPADDIDDYLDPMDIADSGTAAVARPLQVQLAVMVIHGIRDNGFWTKRVARELKTVGRRSGIVVRSPTPSYGYFSMLDFVKPGGRQEATYWFMERYADVRSHFPSAKISFVGHSNGTYIAARALELCPAIKFDRIVFAGSVVRRSFRWGRFTGRVNAVLNYVGSADGVVAFLPAVFEFLHLRWLDVGGAGAFGFRDAEPPPSVAKPLPNESTSPHVELSEFRFVPGGHGAAISEQFWPEIAEFVVLGKQPDRRPAERTDRTRWLFRCAPVITGLGVALAALLLTLPLTLAAVAAAYLAGKSAVSILAIGGTMGAVSVGFLIAWIAARFLRHW
ncbi:hypothetical protein [Piscinibacter sp. XHJ-5]|uniref:hypothetical protein n=1 Tax=Piscinibacter sp. XHJ-5 TaxID=3037797 RepID=UPI0024534456|nr:hypothetical protein [Piscinibacter sp. XHJ-5]